jgi:transcription initiation factor TFIIIB Brf1 subunit/transcription initiation factor TFIIB
MRKENMAGENLTLIEKLLTEARENLDKALKLLQKNTKNLAMELIETAAKNCSEAIELSRMGRLKFKPADAFKNSEKIEEFRKLLQEKGFGETVIKNSTDILQKIGKKKLLDTLDCAVALYLASTLPLDQVGDVFNYTGVTVRRRLRELELAGIASREWKDIKKTVLKS